MPLISRHTQLLQWELPIAVSIHEEVQTYATCSSTHFICKTRSHSVLYQFAGKNSWG